MDLIREHLMYKDVPLHICFKSLKPQEQYECIRLLLVTRTKDVTICKHKSTNKHIDALLSFLSLTFLDCTSS